MWTQVWRSCTISKDSTLPQNKSKTFTAKRKEKHHKYYIQNFFHPKFYTISLIKMEKFIHITSKIIELWTAKTINKPQFSTFYFISMQKITSQIFLTKCQTARLQINRLVFTKCLFESRYKTLTKSNVLGKFRGNCTPCRCSSIFCDRRCLWAMCIIESVSTEKLFEEILKASKENTTLGELQNSKEYSLRIIEIGCKIFIRHSCYIHKTCHWRRH